LQTITISRENVKIEKRIFSKGVISKKVEKGGKRWKK
jgi:hypothetical protein